MAFAIAIGGLWLTNALIDMKSVALLSVTGTVYIDVPSQTATVDGGAGNGDGDGDGDSGSGGAGNGGGGSGMEQGPKPLAAQDIYKVLLNWEAEGTERAHEPSQTQLSMGQAVEAAKSCIAYFVERGVIPAGLVEQELEITSAYLCQNQTHGQTPHFLDPIYSYWTVLLSGDRIGATLTINAVTGQIWKANIVISTSATLFGHQETTKALDSFLSYLDMASGDKIGIGIYGNEMVADTNIVGSMVQAKAIVRAEKTGDASVTTEISLYLCT